MKNLTPLSFFICGLLVAQQPQNYAEVTSQNQINDSNRQTAIIKSTLNSSRSIIDTYTTLIDFQDAIIINCSDPTLTSENFGGGPTGISNCGSIISSAGDGCFSEGELETGFTVQASNAMSTVNLSPNSSQGNIDSLVGALSFPEYIIINFSTTVYAVAMEIMTNFTDLTTVRIFGVGGTLIEELVVTTPINSQTFFGFIADEPISVIEIEAANNSGETFGKFLYGGNCTLSINDNILSELSFYPNPVKDVLLLESPTAIDSIEVFNVLGQPIIAIDSQNTIQNIDMSNVQSGVYLVKVFIGNQTKTIRVLKE